MRKKNILERMLDFIFKSVGKPIKYRWEYLDEVTENRIKKIKKLPKWVIKRFFKQGAHLIPLHKFYFKGKTFLYKVFVKPGEFRGQGYTYVWYRKLRKHKINK